MITKETFEKAEKELKSILFPVELGKVVVQIPNKPNIDTNYFKAVVRADGEQVFSIVTDNYKLISNKKALEIGKEIFEKLFSRLNAEEIKPYKVIFPQSLSYCHIQLVHEKVNFEVFEQDIWLPFIQVSNSYNKTFALSYEIGFVRKLCENGVIFRKNTVKIKTPHNKSMNLDWQLEFGVEELKKMESEFVAYMKNLKRFYINPKYIIPLICKVLHFNFPIDLQDNVLDMSIEAGNRIIREKNEFAELKFSIDNLADRYFNNMGHNAYAAFNIITDLISNENKNIKKFKQFSLHSTLYYYKPTEWLLDFIEKIEKPNFNMEEYLKDYLKYAA